ATLADRPQAVMVVPERPRLPLSWAAFLAFAASAATLVLELVAGRMLAPYVGVSLYTWTSIIGVVLAGISLGNYVGGRLAGRRASSFTLGALFVLSGIASLMILLTTVWVVNVTLPTGFSLVGRIVLYTTTIFFLP